MGEYNFNPRAVLLARLSQEDLDNLAGFDCGDNEMNEFLKIEAYAEQEQGMNNTILLYYKGEVAAFCSICADSLRLVESERENENVSRIVVPAIKIARLGRDVKFKGLKFGQFLVEYVTYLADRLAASIVGVRFITLDAYPNKVDYYTSLGFVKNEAYTRQTRTVSMRLDIFQ